MANLSNINNKLVLTTDGAALINQGTVDYGTAKLQVSGNGSTGTITWRNDGGRKTGYLYSDSTGVAIYTTALNNAGIYLADNLRIDFRVNGSERMRIDSAGNVGIGVTPEAWTGYFPVLQIGDRGALAHYANDSLTISDNWYYDGTNKRIDAGFATRIQIISATGDMHFQNAPTGAADSAITFTTRLFIQDDGNVGIGTTSPSKRLQVSDSATGDLMNILCVNTHDTDGDTASIGFSMVDLNYQKAAIIFERTTTQGRGSLHFATNNVVGNNNVSKGDARMTILSGGNVGIGTTSPSTKLTVDGGLVQVIESGNTAFYGGDYVRMFGTQSYGFRNSGGSSIALISLNGNSYFNGGNVGIGTTTPAYKLVASNGGASGIELSPNALAGLNEILSYNRSTSVYENLRLSVYGFDIYTNNGGNSFAITNTGNVGIGAIPGAVSSSIRVLRIGQRGVFSAYTNSGNVYMSNNVRVISNGNNTAIVTGESAQYRQDGGTHIWYNAASVSAGAVSTLTERMRIASDGVTTIGMTNNIGSAEVRIGGTGNATGNGTGTLNFVNSNSYPSWRIQAGGSTLGNLTFYQSATYGADNFTVESMTVYDGGRLHPVGGVYLGSSNNSNLLDDYEEGAWTPVIRDLNGNQATHAVAQGSYTKIGRQVIINYRVKITSKGSMAGNYVLMSGFPFNHPTESYNGTGMVDFFKNMTTSVSRLAWDTSSTGSVMWLTAVSAAGSTASFLPTVAQISDTFEAKGSVIYTTSVG